MYEWIKTDNVFANGEFRNRLANDPVLAAVIDLLVEKGVVTQAELGRAINDHCQAFVTARENVECEDCGG